MSLYVDREAQGRPKDCAFLKKRKMGSWQQNGNVLNNICTCTNISIKGKGKVVPVLFFQTEHHAMKAYWGVEL
jgi:hypothetical protein